jgi:molecular chaperone GrpE
VAQLPVEDKNKKNTVIDVTQKGYTMGEKVIRYAKVVIGI